MKISTQQALKVLSDCLGRHTPHRNGEYSFTCPFCTHHKKKLQINLETQAYHCWICNARGRSITGLLRKIGASDVSVAKARELYGDGPSTFVKQYVTGLQLPTEYSPLYIKRDTPDYRNALHYATKIRNLSAVDILRYEVGYCESGPYDGMLIIPSYDADGTLNFFTGRSFYPDKSQSHKNPTASKDIIGFEMQINWRVPVVIVEGAFDAIAVRHNAIPLFGKKILSSLRHKLLQEKPPIYFALDRDALSDSVSEIEYFLNSGLDVYFVELNGKDPSELGYIKVKEAIQNSKKVDLGSLMMLKMMLL